jgi:hypothetical protein
MKFNLIQKHKYLNENEDYEYPTNRTNELIDNAILKNRSFPDRPGKIKYAKKHALADRPLHKIKEFTKETDFCQCCNLPCETPGIIEPFKICDSIDKLSECGIGISLFFYFIIYSMIYLLIIIVMLSVPFIIFNKYYSNELKKACNIKNHPSHLKLCDKYIEGSELYNALFISIQFSSDTVYEYREFVIQNNGTDFYVNKTIIRYGLLNFLCTLTLFVVNLYCLILMKHKVNKEKSINCFPSDFTVFLSNLDNVLDFYEDYCITKKKIIYNEKDKFKDFVFFLKTKIISNKKNIRIYMISIFVIN